MCEEIKLSWGPLVSFWLVILLIVLFSMLLGEVGIIVGAFFVLIAVLSSISYLFYRWGHKLQLCEDRIIWHEGILAKHQTSVLLQDIKVIDVKQPFTGRLFNFGTLKIGTAGTGDYEIVAYYIPDPYGLREKLYEQKKNFWN